eukprot:CAMPEP_0174723102 /NCGR_PEP_ID=MMETSP1094-20130205/40068_1 /TAXON_ID=156173 /ORGANISM="Chrysochromulina brevifilum, Strain UTEX LB 985" /LENGTH=179 /DNA_ID=CAMNT_0015924085 /DNA_START=30 /DNA_END=565 /DNA_ORIENTATION=+
MLPLYFTVYPRLSLPLAAASYPGSHCLTLPWTASHSQPLASQPLAFMTRLQERACAPRQTTPLAVARTTLMRSGAWRDFLGTKVRSSCKLMPPLSSFGVGGTSRSRPPLPTAASAWAAAALKFADPPTESNHLLLAHLCLVIPNTHRDPQTHRALAATITTVVTIATAATATTTTTTIA